jgi:hypothetical protein
MSGQVSGFMTRLGLAILAAWLAALITSGTIFVFAFEEYNPWYHPGRERENWNSALIFNALWNVFEHGFYPFFILLLGPIWFLGIRAERNVVRTAAILFAVTFGSLIAWAAASHLDLDTTTLRFTDDRILYVAFWHRIYVPNFLYPVAALVMPVVAAMLLVAFDAIMANLKSRNSHPSPSSPERGKAPPAHTPP